ncbi:MAG TPA: glycosyl hydrolase 115 family protein [Steroidobacteraceae bacterium]|nr:glycosyl hydrolase 115 family protein [Steroidobacteraceae bacterium]
MNLHADLPATAHARVRQIFVLCLLSATSTAHAMVGEQSFVAFARVARGAELAAHGEVAPIWVDVQDYEAVKRAASDLQKDLERVTAIKPALQMRADSDIAALASNRTPARLASTQTVIIAGTVGHSRLIDELVAQKKLDVHAIAGKWESFLVEVIERPLAGVERAVVIAGSDRRGTVYGLYDLSEQIGVSPWYWWADVPVQKHDTLYVKPGRTIRGEPAVKYRGIFINDEAPAMSGWAQEKFGGFNHELYGHVFELILRLRGNYLWPAMWDPHAFIDDDPQNAALADEYGIVIGTSHHEPMMRAHDEWRRYGSGPWDYSVNGARLREFWRSGVARVLGNEKIVTIGMRGNGDEAMSAETNVALLERIVADQRNILETLTKRPAAETPQVWALYKEVQDYYEQGMRVPDDVTLLWSDDNWGNIRRLPLPSERGRSGGAGVYYHFDYVGGPRNYKWINTVPITKVWEQMNLAWQYGATRIWIVNVGDLKPMEFPIEFFLTLAWDPSRWSQDTLDDYSTAWAAREFGPRYAAEIASLINGYTKLNGRRKPEMLAPDTYSLVSYQEADRVLAEWAELVARAEHIYEELPEEQRAAFFQLVLYPVKASAGIHELYIATGRNHLYARQGRAGANVSAERARALFARDAALVRAYHELNGGKWNHMMSQAKLGYTTWQQPDIEVAPALSEVHPREDASMAIAVEGSEVAHPSQDAGTATLPPLDVIAQGSRTVEVFNRGTTPFTYTVSADPQIVVAPSSGKVSDSAVLRVTANWNAVPPGDSVATLTIHADTGEAQTVRVPLSKPSALPPRGFKGFVESDRHIAIEAPHFSRAIGGGAIAWRTLPDFGRTLGGVTSFPVTAPESKPRARLEYDTWLFSTGELRVELQLAPSLDFQSGAGLRVGVSFDDEPPQILRLATMGTRQDWDRAVADGVRRLVSTHKIESPGRHVLKVWRVTPGVVLERVIIDAGGVRPSYLGPPETARRN